MSDNPLDCRYSIAELVAILKRCGFSDASEQQVDEDSNNGAPFANGSIILRDYLVWLSENPIRRNI